MEMVSWTWSHSLEKVDPATPSLSTGWAWLMDGYEWVSVCWGMGGGDNNKLVVSLLFPLSHSLSLVNSTNLSKRRSVKSHSLVLE